MAINAGTIYSQMVLDNKQYMRSMKAAHGQLKAFEDQVNRSSQMFTSSMTNLDKQYRLWELNTDSISKALFRKSKQTELTRQKMSLLEDEIANTSSALNEAKDLYGENSTEVKELENSLLDLKIEHAELNKSMEQFTLPNTLKRAGSQMEDFGRSMSLRVTLPIVGAGAAAVKSTALFDDRMAAVRAVSGATSEQFQMLRTRAREMGRDTRFSASEAAEGMENLARAGFDVDEIYETIPHMLNLASAGQLELADAASITANMINAFGLEAEDAEHVTGVLAKAAADADTDIYGLGEAMTYLAPTAHDFGWSIEEASAAIMVLSDAGLKGGRAGAVFSSSLSKLTKPTDEAAELMEELNLEFFDANGAMKPLPAVVAELEQGLSGMTDKQKSATLATLFGSRAQKHWSILLNKGSDSLEEMTGVLEESTDEAQRQSDIMEDNFAGAWREFKSAIGEVAIVIGDIVTPKLRELAEWLRDVAVRFSELDPNMQRNIVKILGIIAAIGPLLMIGGRLFRGVGNLMNGFGELRAFLGGPLTLAIMAIAVLAFIVIKYWEPISGFFKDLWEGIKDITSSVWESIKDIITTVSGAIKDFVVMIWTGVKDFIIGVWEAIYNITTTIWNGIVDFMTPILEFIKNLFEFTFLFIKMIIETVFLVIKTIIQTVINIIVAIIETAWEIIRNITEWIWGYIGEYVIGIWEGIKEVCIIVWTAIKDFIISVWTFIKEKAIAIYTPIRDFIVLVWTTIRDKTLTIWNAIMEVIIPIWLRMKEIASTVFNAIKNVVVTIWNIIKRITTSVWNAIVSTITSILNTLKSIFSRVFNTIKSVVTRVWGAIKNITSSVWNTIKSIITGIVNGIKSVISNVFNAVYRVVSNIWNRIKNVTVRIWNKIRNAIVRPVHAARDKVEDALDAIHGFFAKLKLPEIKIPKPKLPHFRVTGKFSFNPPQVPKFSVDWYKEGAIFTKPTIFATPFGLKGISEAGAEAVLPIEKLSEIFAGTIEDVVARQTVQTPEHGGLYELTNAIKNAEKPINLIMDERVVGRVVAPIVSEEINSEIMEDKLGKGGLIW